MNLGELINQNLSKKMGIAVIGIIALVHVGAPSAQIMAVAIVAVIVQGILDFKENKDVPKNDSVNDSDSN